MFNVERLKIMKTTMKIKVMGYRLWVTGMIALLPALAAAVEYKSTYGGGYSQPAYGIAVTATAPSATFQSTSAFSNQWAVKGDVQSMLNADGSIASDGTASAPYSSHVRKGGPGGGASGPGTPGGDLDPTTQQPVGDALLPLLVMALGYFAIRRRRSARL